MSLLAHSFYYTHFFLISYRIINNFWHTHCEHLLYSLGYEKKKIGFCDFFILLLLLFILESLFIQKLV